MPQREWDAPVDLYARVVGTDSHVVAHRLSDSGYMLRQVRVAGTGQYCQLGVIVGLTELMRLVPAGGCTRTMWVAWSAKDGSSSN
jgi:hypothetical protein